MNYRMKDRIIYSFPKRAHLVRIYQKECLVYKSP